MRALLQTTCLSVFFLMMSLCVVGQTMSCVGITNTIDQPSGLCSTTKPATISQPPATTTTGLAITYGWQSSTTSPTSGYTLLTATSQDLPVPSRPDTYYYKRIVYLWGTSPITGALVVVQQCESNAVEVVITTQPFVVTQSAVSADVCSGAGTSFSISVFSIGKITHQWQEDNGSGFIDIFSGSVYSGVNSNTLTISNAAGLGEKKFRCMVTSQVNGDCQGRSVVFSLHEKPAPVVTPLARDVCERVTPTGSVAIIDLGTINNSLTASDPNNLSVSWFTYSPRTSISDPANFQFTGTAMLSANVSNTTTYCAADASVTLTAKPSPTATATVQSSSNLCHGEYFDVALQGGDQYQWTVAAPTEIQGAVAGQGAAIHQALTNGGSQDKTITYTILPTKNGCTGPPVDVTATVQPEVKKFTVTGGGEMCLGDAGVTIGLVNSQPHIDYELERDGQPTGITVNSPGGPFVYPNPIASNGTFTIHATVNGLCETDMDGNAIVAVRTAPQGTGILSGDNIVCQGSTQTYEASGWTGATDYHWILPTQMRSVREEGQVAEIVAEQTGEVQLQVVGVNLCGAGLTATKSVSIHENPVIAIEEPQVLVAGQPFNPVYNSTTPLMQWQWNFGDGGSSASPYPEHTYDKPGPYLVSLNAIDENNCSGTSTLNLAVTTAISSNNIKNVITANGDSQNGYLIVENLEKFPDNEVVLLTRWGNEVFRKKGYTNDWDTRIDGYFLPAGNYVCIVRLMETNTVFSRVVTVIKD